MATRADLQKAVEDTTAAANSARADWKEAIPGEGAPKMTDEEQAVVNDLENKFLTAKAARKAAEQALADFDTAETARKAAAAAATPVAAKKDKSKKGLSQAETDELKYLGYI